MIDVCYHDIIKSDSSTFLIDIGDTSWLTKSGKQRGSLCVQGHSYDTLEVRRDKSML
jgi:hypothetical protein